MSASEPPDGFSEQERITANLRFRSLPATQRTLLGLFAIVPRPWRGPVALAAMVLLALLALKALPALVTWLLKMREVKP